jgi:hypothetical protein
MNRKMKHFHTTISKFALTSPYNLPEQQLGYPTELSQPASVVTVGNRTPESNIVPPSNDLTTLPVL